MANTDARCRDYAPVDYAASFSTPVLAAKPVWPVVVVHLHGAGQAFIVDTKTDALVATLDTCKGGTLGAITPDAIRSA